MQWSLDIKTGGKQEFAAPRDRAQLPEQGQRLTAEGNQMLHARFHTLGRDAPLSILKIELAPARFPKFSRSHEEEGREPQGDSDNTPTLVSINRVQ